MRLNDMTNQRFGRLTVLERVTTENPKKVYWKCRCDCGQETIARGDHLRYGLIQSCGCWQDEARRKTHTSHGGYHSRLYKVYRTMLARCHNPNNKMYYCYGGRGITVCDEWQNDFAKFREWAMSTGYDEDAARGECTIDRIDPNGNYEPNNCRWVSMEIQNKNKRPRRRKHEKSR